MQSHLFFTGRVFALRLASPLISDRWLYKRKTTLWHKMLSEKSKSVDSEPTRPPLLVGLTFLNNNHFPLMYRSIPKPPIPPPRANPRAFDFFEKFWSNSPLCCQLRRSNAPPVRASKRVKSPHPPGKTESLTFGNKH